jgi:hypothetical protein
MSRYSLLSSINRATQASSVPFLLGVSERWAPVDHERGSAQFAGEFFCESYMQRTDVVDEPFGRQTPRRWRWGTPLKKRTAARMAEPTANAPIVKSPGR